MAFAGTQSVGFIFADLKNQANQYRRTGGEEAEQYFNIQRQTKYAEATTQHQMENPAWKYQIENPKPKNPKLKTLDF